MLASQFFVEWSKEAASTRLSTTFPSSSLGRPPIFFFFVFSWRYFCNRSFNFTNPYPITHRTATVRWLCDAFFCYSPVSGTSSLCILKFVFFADDYPNRSPPTVSTACFVGVNFAVHNTVNRAWSWPFSTMIMVRSWHASLLFETRVFRLVELLEILVCIVHFAGKIKNWDKTMKKVALRYFPGM